ncbi:MAG: DUF3108 domain-containing protein [Desulfuromonadales bacterium]|nr:DUF3108 domain-containing protein [Desulfuromonadales bacterium]
MSLVSALITVAAMLPAMAAEATTPAPFAATYAVSYRGLNAGELRSTLLSGAPGEYVYETRVSPSPLARFVVSDKALERSVMRIDASGVRPLSWSSEDGKAGGARDGALEFAWNEHRVSGVVEGQWVELPTEPMLQDRLSIQIAVITALLRDDGPDTLALIDDEKIKRYSYTRAGTERIETRAGRFDTVVYESTRPGSSRLSRVWHAPELGYVPVRAEQLRNGKVETVMELIKVRVNGA